MISKPTQGHLIEKLRRVIRGPVSTLGFGRAEAPKVPALVLIVAPNRLDAELVGAAAKGGADAMALPLDLATLPTSPEGGIDYQQAKTDLLTATDQHKSVPWGLRVSGENAHQLTADDLQDLGADFLIADVSAAPATLLAAKGFGRIARVDTRIDPYLLRTINELPIEAVQVDIATSSDGNAALSIHDIMEIRQVADMTVRPLVVSTKGRLNPQDVPALRLAGIAGLLLDEETTGNDAKSVEETTRAFRTAIDQAGGPLVREKRGGVIVPQIAPSIVPGKTEPEVPEEPDEEW